MRSRTAVLASMVLALTACSSGSDGATESAGPEEPAGLPGGSAGADALTSAGLLSEGGVLTVEDSRSLDEHHDAACEFLFGSSAAVAETAGLPSGTTLNSDANWDSLIKEGSGLYCVYEHAGETVFALSLWSQDVYEPSDVDVVFVETQGDGEAGMGSYLVDVEDQAMDKAELEAWLTEAMDRIELVS